MAQILEIQDETFEREIQQKYKVKPKLTKKQWEIFYYVYKLLTDEEFKKKNSTAIFIDGSVGSGKTEVAKALCEFVVKKWSIKKDKIIIKNAIFTASTGVAARSITKGRTAHSMFGFPINLPAKTSWKITKNEEEIRESLLIVYDEVSMANRGYIELLDKGLRQLMESDEIFGGKIIIFVGDFRKPAPILKEGSEQKSIVEASPLFSPLWRNMKTFTLPHRTFKDEWYSQFVLHVGSGTIPNFSTQDRDDNSIRLENIGTLKLSDLIAFVFPQNILEKPDTCARRAILTPRHAEVKAINEEILKKHMTGDLIHCRAIGEDKTLKRLEEVEPYFSSIPDSDLLLKKGCLCMVTRNIEYPTTLTVGTKVVIVDVSDDYVTVYKARKSGPKTCHKLQRVECMIDLKNLGYKSHLNFRKMPEVLNFGQFPLKVCYSMTIHKSQGQTLDKIGLDLRYPIFAHGQLYLALSRVRRRDHIKVLVDKENISDNNTAIVKNIVYRDLVTKYVNESSIATEADADLCQAFNSIAL